MQRSEGWQAAIHSLAFWGVWPTLLMVLCQWEVGRLLSNTASLDVMLLTLGGTLGIYGFDHFVENLSQSHLAPRHQGLALFHSFMVLCVLLAVTSGVFLLQKTHVIWLAVLTISGLIYLLTTWGRTAYIPTFKELLGAWCLTFLVWGTFGWDQPAWVIAFFAMGLANFLQASIQDRLRDKANCLRSLPLDYPRATYTAAKIAALIATALFLVNIGWSPFSLCAALHLCWPVSSKWSIDWAFLPMLATLLFKA